MQLIYSSVSSVRAPRARETRCDVRILPATEHCCQRAEIRRNGPNVHEGGRPPPNRLRVGHDFARFQWFSRGVPPFRAAGAATGAAWKFIERAWTRNGAFTDPRIEYRLEQGRVVWKFRNGISSRRFLQQYRKLLDLVTLSPPPLLPLSQGHAVVVRIDPSTGLATFEGFLLSFYLVDRSDLISSPCITTLISHDFQLGRYFSRAERAKETSRDPPPYRIFYLYELDS